jgi:hypothetical protein
MKGRILRRLERLEASLASKLVPLIRYGWLATLPAGYAGERHIVTLKCEPTGSPRVEWCEWEERPELALVDTGDSVPTAVFTEADRMR